MALVVMGGIFALLGLAGGGIRTKWIEVPSQLSRGLRTISSIAGAVLILTGIGLFIMEKQPTILDDDDVGMPAPISTELDITGDVVDIFGNPRKGVIVIVRGVQRYAFTDKKGLYHITNVPFQNSLTLEAYYGKEGDNLGISLDEKAPGKTENVPRPLVLNPITIDAVLCSGVFNTEEGGLTPEGTFEGENPRIPLESLPMDSEQKFREIWCFVKVIGPLKYEVGRDTELTYEWYYAGDLQSKPFKQSVGVRPFGWRTRASKRVWAGEWLLKIKSKHEELAWVPFEIY
jgi:hypothetical protein